MYTAIYCIDKGIDCIVLNLSFLCNMIGMLKLLESLLPFGKTAGKNQPSSAALKATAGHREPHAARNPAYLSVKAVGA